MQSNQGIWMRAMVPPQLFKLLKVSGGIIVIMHLHLRLLLSKCKGNLISNMIALNSSGALI